MTLEELKSKWAYRFEITPLRAPYVGYKIFEHWSGTMRAIIGEGDAGLTAVDLECETRCKVVTEAVAKQMGVDARAEHDRWMAEANYRKEP
jgi:hypothetical protein